MARAQRIVPVRQAAEPAALRALLQAASLKAADPRAAVTPVLREALERGREHARARLEAGAKGVEVARLYAAAADAVVTALWDFVTLDLHRADNPTEGERLSLLAVGGYGRGVLAPFSDLDLLFLRPWKTTAHAENVVEFMLYVLWDLGLKVGWAARSVDECLKLARRDMTIRTTLLEARPLAGDEALSEEFLQRFRRRVARADPRPFIAAKLEERDVRQAKVGASRYRVEPNLKDGKGGLRDLNTLFWIARSLAPDSVLGARALEGLLTGRERRTFEQAFDFLWSVRCHLHLVAGRAEERLTFDVQPEIARRMGWAGRGDEPAVERFMRRYFLVARDVGSLTRALCAKLEERQQKAPQGLSRLIPGRGSRRRKLEVEGFVEDGGRLSVTGPEVFAADPVNLLRLFRTADRHDLDLHPDAFTAVTRSLDLVTPKLRRDPAAGEAFLDVLARGERPYRVLSIMNDTGLLGRFLPEFARVVGQTQFNRYHAYTVDEHTLKAIGILNDIARGKLAGDHPLATAVWPLIADHEALYLAMLLHDVGKGGSRGQLEDGAIAARRACERLGVSRPQAELVAWLVRHHLVFSDYAQKRDVSDPDTVAAFMDVVGDPDRLRLLLVMTVADVRAVGPGVWNGWKGQLMRDLYSAVEAAFRGGRDGDPASAVRRRLELQAAGARAALAAGDPAVAAWAAAMEDAYFAAFPTEVRRGHARLARAAAESGAAAEVRLRPDLDAAELSLAARDRPGLFADVAAALADQGADVVGARIFTSSSGDVLDVFYLHDGAGQPLGRDHPAGLKAVVRAVEAAARGQRRQAAEPRRPPPPRRAAFEVASSVAFDNEATDAATIVEVAGRDRPGLLADLAQALADSGLSIQSAHIDSHGERAVDAFYVRCFDNRKLTSASAQTRLRKALLRALDAAPPAPAGRALTRARASAAR